MTTYVLIVFLRAKSCTNFILYLKLIISILFNMFKRKQQTNEFLLMVPLGTHEVQFCFSGLCMGALHQHISMVPNPSRQSHVQLFGGPINIFSGNSFIRDPN